MAKRKIPLFIFDTARQHGHGECDFIVCTDQESGFIAKVDLINGAKEEVTDTYRISEPINGVSCKIEIKRITGSNPDKAAIRTLLRKAYRMYMDRTSKQINVDEPGLSDMLAYCAAMEKSARSQLAQTKDYEIRKVIGTSIIMLGAIANKLREE